MSKEPKLLEVQHATVYRGQTRVFEELDLEVECGRSTAILGPNGAGKTTLLRLLTRDLYPVFHPRTRVRVLGRESWNVFDLRRKLGVVSHELQLQYQRDVRGTDVVLSGFFASIGVYRHQAVDAGQRRRAEQLLRDLGSAHLADKLISAMSAGEQRRCLLARALVHDPSHLVLDEPTNSLDLKASFELLAVLRRLAQAGKTLVLVTHRIEEIPPEVEWVVLLQGGRVVAQGEKREMLTTERLSALFDVPLQVVEQDGHYRPFPLT